MSTDAYRVHYREGLGQPVVVYATSIDEAKKLALAEYRRNCTQVDFFPLDFVVQHAECLP